MSNSSFIKILIAGLLLFALSTQQKMYAVKAYPGLVTVKQPDGSSLSIRLYGDEFTKIKTTQDGYLVTQNKAGYYVYATIDAQGKTKETTQIANNAEKRTAADAKFMMKLPEKITGELIKTSAMRVKSPTPKQSIAPKMKFPTTGSPKSIVILVNYSDINYVVPNPTTAFNNLLNQPGYSVDGATGSAKDYFISATFGKFTPTFDVYGPYNLPHNMAYYGKNLSTDGNDTLPTNMIVDACKAADAAGVNFAQYDTDNDGYIDNVFVYYAGYNEAEGGPENSIWPHRWLVAPTGTYPGGNYVGNNADVTFDGKILWDYACTSELKSNSGSTMAAIGTFCHEFGHVLGLPDLYHTTEPKLTLQSWDIMDSGSYNNYSRTPPTYSAYERFYLGYFTPTEVKNPSECVLYPIYQGKTIPPTFNNQSVLLSQTTHNLSGSNPSPTEFFLLEYRKKTGWDAFLPTEGLVIWHIDYDVTAWNNNAPNNYTNTSPTQTAASHMRVYIQPLSGSSTTPGTAFTTGNFTPLKWDGTDINRKITQITKYDSYMSFKVMDDVQGVPKVKSGIVESTLTYPDTKTGKSNPKYLTIQTINITGDLTVSVTGTHAAYFSASAATITKASANSAAGYVITVTYTPGIVGNHIATLTISGGGLPDKVITLTGKGI